MINIVKHAYCGRTDVLMPIVCLHTQQRAYHEQLRWVSPELSICFMHFLSVVHSMNIVFLQVRACFSYAQLASSDRFASFCFQALLPPLRVSAAVRDMAPGMLRLLCTCGYDQCASIKSEIDAPIKWPQSLC